MSVGPEVGREHPERFARENRRRIEALERLPPPVAADDHAWIRRSLEYGANKVVPSTGSDINITYDATDGSPTPDYTVFFTTPTNYQIEIQVTGWYMNTVEVIWDDIFYDDCWLFLNDDIGMPTAFGPWKQPVAESGAQAFSFPHRYTLGELIYVTILQESGVDKHIDAAYWEVTYMGSYTGTNPVDSNPDQ